jgi:3-oxoacyl-[acyl-carrier protein] reductase
MFMAGSLINSSTGWLTAPRDRQQHLHNGLFAFLQSKNVRSVAIVGRNDNQEAASRDGHHVVINYRATADQAQALAKELGRGTAQAVALQADVCIAKDVDRLIGGTIGHFGRLDCVVNNAGIGGRIALDALDEAAFSRTIHANLTSAFLVSQAAWTHMTKRGGRLVFLSSGAARTGGGLSAAYAASKGGIESLMHYYASYLRPYRITANAIAPAFIETDMAQALALPPPANSRLAVWGSRMRFGQPSE